MDPVNLTPVEQLFQPLKRRFKIVTLPVSGAVVRIRSLTERELSAHQMAAYQFKDGQAVPLKQSFESATRRFIALCLVDADGNRLLRPEDAGRLAEWDSADTSFLYNECSTHTRTRQEDIEAIAKNSDATPAA